MMKISVIVPIYNTGQYLERCLDSIINQNFKEIEIIIVNDCSPDNSLDIIKNYQKKDSRIILINKEKNEGLSAARNSGIEVANGEYILHIDSDDWIEQNYFKNMYESAKKNNADIVISDYYEDFDNGKTKYIGIKDDISHLNNKEIIEKIFLCNLSPAVWNKLIKTELYKKNNIFHPKKITIGEDLAVVPKLIYYANKVINIKQPYYHYIQNINSVTKKRLKTNKKLYDIYIVVNILEKFFKSKKEIMPINEMKINYLSAWLLYSKNKKEQKYKEILNEYLLLLKNTNIRKLSSIKIKVLAFFIKVFL